MNIPNPAGQLPLTNDSLHALAKAMIGCDNPCEFDFFISTLSEEVRTRIKRYMYYEFVSSNCNSEMTLQAYSRFSDSKRLSLRSDWSYLQKMIIKDIEDKKKGGNIYYFPLNGEYAHRVRCLLANGVSFEEVYERYLWICSKAEIEPQFTINELRSYL